MLLITGQMVTLAADNSHRHAHLHSLVATVSFVRSNIIYIDGSSTMCAAAAGDIITATDRIAWHSIRPPSPKNCDCSRFESARAHRWVINIAFC